MVGGVYPGWCMEGYILRVVHTHQGRLEREVLTLFPPGEARKGF